MLITVNEATTRPFALCRATCRCFEVPVRGTFDVVFRRLVERLQGTKRMLMYDEADLASYPALEMIRQLHDATGCPVLFAGKPKIYEHLGFRKLGEFSESLDQLARASAHRWGTWVNWVVCYATVIGCFLQKTPAIEPRCQTNDPNHCPEAMGWQRKSLWRKEFNVRWPWGIPLERV